MKKYYMMALVLLSGCGSPGGIETQKLGDENMSCTQLVLEIERCEKDRRQLPIGSEAYHELEDRKNHLLSLYRNRGCNKK